MRGNPVPFSDAELVTRLRQRDEFAFDALFTRYYSALLTYITHAIGSQFVAEELTQEVFLSLWEHPEVTVSEGGLRPWLYTLARNRILNYHRGERRQQRALERYTAELHDILPLDDTHEALEHHELAQRLEEALARLPDRAREVWTLHREHGLTYPEIAATMGISVNTVKTQMSRALNFLRSAGKPLLSLLFLVHW